QRERSAGQLSFFDQGLSKVGFNNTQIELPQIKEWPEPQILAFEKDMLGFYVSGHPLARYANQLKRFASTSTSKLLLHKDEEEIKLVSLIAKIKQTVTRAKQEKMAILKLEDLEGVVEALVFPKTFQKVSRYILPNTVVLVKGILNLKEDTPKIIVNDMIPMDAVYKLINAININLTGMQENIFISLKELLSANNGQVPIYLHLDTPAKAKVQLIVGESLFVNPSEQLIGKIIDLLGENRLSLIL
ncbi:MAG: OB-fold nucleic acid binding domain-containing protein, partial [Candidatus Omnitrophota bacterium]